MSDNFRVSEADRKVTDQILDHLLSKQIGPIGQNKPKGEARG